MKRILYIDDKEDDARWKTFKDKIENLDQWVKHCREVYKKDDQFVDISEFNVIFIHKNNNGREKFINQIDTNQMHVIVFAGDDYPIPIEEGNLLKIHEEHLMKCFPDFVKNFTQNKINFDCFKKRIFISEAHNIRHKIINNFSPFFLRVDSLDRKKNANAFKGCEEYLKEFKNRKDSQKSLLSKLGEIINTKIPQKNETKDALDKLTSFFAEQSPFGILIGSFHPDVTKWVSEVNTKKEELKILKNQWETEVIANLNLIVEIIDREMQL